MDTSSPAYQYARRIEKENRLSSGEKIIVKAYLSRILDQIEDPEANQIIRGLIFDMSSNSETTG